VEPTGAGVLVLAVGAGLEELAGVAGELDEADDPQPANARVAKQASAAAAHLVRELPNLAITVVPSNTIRALMPLCHYDDWAGAPVA
jgi:putative heme iron utilization protein